MSGSSVVGRTKRIIDRLAARVTSNLFVTRGSPQNLAPRDLSPEALQRDVDYGVRIIGSFENWSQGAGVDLRDKRVLEIGPGVNLAGSIGLKALGAAEVIASDRWIPVWRDEYNPLFCHMMAQRLRAERPHWDAEPFEQAAAHGFGRVVTLIESPAEQLAARLPGQVDAVFSNAVLEHMADHRATVNALYSLTRPGGIGFHQVDFRDHRDFSRPLEYLLYAPAEYAKRALKCDFEFGCQLRPHELKALFEQAGFHVDYQVSEVATEPYLADVLTRLRRSRSRYRDMDETLLKAIGGFFIVRK